MTNYNERLDKALERLAVAGRGWGVSEDAQIESMIIDLAEAKQEILRWVADEVIGENETGVITDPDSVDYGKPYSNVYVDRDEQRKILAQHGYKGDQPNDKL